MRVKCFPNRFVEKNSNCEKHRSAQQVFLSNTVTNTSERILFECPICFDRCCLSSNPTGDNLVTFLHTSFVTGKENTHSSFLCLSLAVANREWISLLSSIMRTQLPSSPWDLLLACIHLIPESIFQQQQKKTAVLFHTTYIIYTLFFYVNILKIIVTYRNNEVIVMVVGIGRHNTMNLGTCFSPCFCVKMNYTYNK